MNVLAWLGVGIAALVLAVWFLPTVIGMLLYPLSRALVYVWTSIVIIVWGLLGGIYLTVEAVR